jgi:hypothetical protein
MSLYSEREWIDDQREFGDHLDERYLIDRAEHEAHAEGNEEEPDEPEWNDCGHDRAKRDDIECPECGADLAALGDGDDDEPDWPYGVSYGPEFFADRQE